MKPKVILIGDSIRMYYAPVVTKQLAGLAEVWEPADNGETSKKVLAHLEDWALKRQADLIHINCGLHDLAIDSPGAPNRIAPEQYAANLKEIFKQLRERTKAKLVWATTTPTINERHIKVKNFERREADVLKYNAIALKEAVGISINDLYAIIMAAGPEECLLPDGVHMAAKGNELLADVVTAKIRAELGIG